MISYCKPICSLFNFYFQIIFMEGVCVLRVFCEYNPLPQEGERKNRLNGVNST
ncbi:hypothetical protein EPIR_0750 [Erwinia piriflorinigrans CFBP 5888]|uniref:Uncharacterized protein n=1 Tax=Erwinia piriflorinigrans CFBP 5888 TaxID=1161919 RepID=V5Z532_9GAMM|nr:hypothetical protein EPIR_0750 [Erwinia piriflorinigrans CFBP 5888]